MHISKKAEFVTKPFSTLDVSIFRQDSVPKLKSYSTIRPEDIVCLVLTENFYADSFPLKNTSFHAL